jgi:hypothetical protein
MSQIPLVIPLGNGDCFRGKTVTDSVGERWLISLENSDAYSQYRAVAYASLTYACVPVASLSHSAHSRINSQYPAVAYASLSLSRLSLSLSVSLFHSRSLALSLSSPLPLFFSSCLPLSPCRSSAFSLSRPVPHSLIHSLLLLSPDVLDVVGPILTR